MRPVHIVILVLAGALGGAGIMKVVQLVRPAAHSNSVAHAQVPVSVTPGVADPAPVPEPAPVADTPVPPAPEPGPEPEAIPARAKPSPMPVAARRENPKPLRTRPVSPYYSVAPVVIDPGPQMAQATPPAPTAPTPTIAPPPVSTEPENATPASPPASVAPAPQPHQVTLNAGLMLPTRLVDTLSSERNAPGDVFQATLDQELVVDGFVIAERGARVEGQVIAADRSGRGKGGAALALALTRLHTSDGQTVSIQTDDYFRHAENAGGQNAAKIGGGAVIGAVIGAIAAGGKGAAIGAGVGGAAGTGDVLLTRKPAELKSETRVVFRLRNPVSLTERLR